MKSKSIKPYCNKFKTSIETLNSQNGNEIQQFHKPEQKTCVGNIAVAHKWNMVQNPRKYIAITIDSQLHILHYITLLPNPKFPIEPVLPKPFCFFVAPKICCHS
jgi:hypothetical protein